MQATEHGAFAVDHGFAAGLELEEMDDQTRELLLELEKRFALQLKPIEERQNEGLVELREWRKQINQIETDRIVMHDRMERYEKDLTKGFTAIRETMSRRDKELEEKLKVSNRWIAPLAGGVPVIITILVALFIWWAKVG